MYRRKMLSTMLFVVALASHIPGAHAEKIDGDRLLDPQRVVDVRITIDPADWQKLRGQQRDVGAFFRGGALESVYSYFKADLWIDGQKIESVGVRKKGLFGSVDFQRPSLKIKFDQYVEQDPIKGLSRLTLNNNKQDTALVSQLLTYKLFRDAGIHAPRTGFAKVTVNDDYLGIYTNVESIKKPFLKRSFGDNSGNLYEGTLTDFYPKTIEKLEIKTNADTNDRSDITSLTSVIAAEGKTDLARLEQLIDVENFMRFWAVEGLVRFWDGYAGNQNNFFLYMNPTDGKGLFIPWGADGSFSLRGGPFSFGQAGPTSIYAQSTLSNRLYHTEGFPERYKATMVDLLKNVWKEDELLAEIDRVQKLLGEHLPASQRSAGRAMDDLREFIRTRRDTINDELKDWPADIPDQPRKPMYTIPVGSGNASFATTFTKRTGPDAAAEGKARLELEMNGRSTEVKHVRSSVRSFQTPQFGFGRRPGAGPSAPQVMMTLSFVRSSDDEKMSVSFIVDQTLFANSAGKIISVNGSLTEGPQRQPGGFGGFGGGGPSVNGQLTLTKTGIEEGDEVAGTLKLAINEVRGGFFDRRRPPQRGGRGFGNRRPGGGRDAGNGGPGGGRGFGNGGPGRPAGPGGGRNIGNRPDQETRPQRPQRPPADADAAGVSPATIHHVIDADGNGKLSAAEIKRAAAAILTLDRNKDGEISSDELSNIPAKK